MPNRLRYLCTLFSLAFLLASCASTHNGSGLSMQAPFEPENYTLNSRLVQKNIILRKSNLASDYRIGPEDLLDISVFQVDELDKSVRVNAEGNIKLPLVGEVKASGLTASELEAELSKLLERYLEEPSVSVFISEYRSQQITVLGAVKNPQIYSVSGQKYLLDMLSMAGGLTKEAKSICYIQKISEEGPSGGQYVRTVVVDLDKLLIDGQADLNIPVSAGDVIHVPEGDVIFIDGAVVSPGSYQIKGTATLTQSMSMAKGFRYEAARDRVRIYRDNGKPERDVITVDYDSILDGRSPDIKMADKDIIIVPKSGVRNFFKGLATTLNLGIFSIGKSL